MCELCVVNTHDELLNKTLALVNGNLGSTVHSDGWGITDGNKDWKCSLPMFLTANAGGVIKKEIPKTGKNPLMLHIRRASPRVPVVLENSHPFVAEQWKLMHNGKLSPKDEKGFVMEEDFPDIDDKTGFQRTGKDGLLLTKKMNRSDSLIFFEQFIKDWNAKIPEADPQTPDEVFVEVLNTTMSKFKGKFAFLISRDKTMYVVRGKTAKLFISYLRETKEVDSPVIGFVVNTSETTMYQSLGLVSSLRELQGLERLYYSYPESLAEETIYKVEKFDLTKIGKIAENPEYAPTVYAGSRGQSAEWDAGGTNFTKTGGKGTTATNIQNTGTKSKMELHREKLTKEVFNFLVEYSLSPVDLQNMFLAFYDISIEQLELPMLHQFATKIIPNICSHYVKKDMKKNMKLACKGLPVGLYQYGNQDNYPWIFIPKNLQEVFIKKITKDEES